MSAFVTSLQVELVSESPKKWRLISPLIYQSDLTSQVLTVPAGFETNFASVPRLPLAYWLCGGIGDRAAALHDHLYTTGQLIRVTCNALFREALLTCGVSAWRAYLMWSMVRAFGTQHYHQYQEELVQ